MARGNHEAEEVNRVYGFENEVLDKYDSKIFRMFQNVFDWLPVTHCVNQAVLVMHGGLPCSTMVKTHFLKFKLHFLLHFCTTTAWEPHFSKGTRGRIYLPTPVDFKALPVHSRQNFLALEQHQLVVIVVEKEFCTQILATVNRNTRTTRPPTKIHTTSDICRVGDFSFT